MTTFFEQLETILNDRKTNPSPDSYTSHLLTKGEDAILQKVGEEAVEVILAAKGQGDERLIEESADLMYHFLLMLVAKGLSWQDVLAELEKRHR